MRVKGVCMFKNLVCTQSRWGPFFDIIFVKIDSWIVILWRFEFSEKCLQSL